MWKPTTTDTRLRLSDEEFACLATLVRRRTGIEVNPAKRQLFCSRLAGRLRALGFTSFDQYRQVLMERPGGEFTRLIDAITTNPTNFFRENDQFEYLGRQLLPAILGNSRGPRCLRIWSAGCATGEEAYAIAMVAAERIQHLRGWEVSILATDLDPALLRQAEQGIYDVDRLRAIVPERLQRWFRSGEGARGRFTVSSELQDMITFRPMNLLEEWSAVPRFQVIFCRNVVIYFDKSTQRDIIERFADHLDQDGHLFLGHAESLYQVSERFQPVGRTVFRKHR